MKGVYCNSGCGSRNNPGAMNCQVCGSSLKPTRRNPITSAEFANQKLAVFDIDSTILDTGQRFQDAKRAGLVNKDGSIPKGKVKAREEFLYRDDILSKDRVIPNTMDLMEYLMERGYVIAYCTARPYSTYEATKAQLQDKGFPLFQNAKGETLLYCKRQLGLKKPVYKANVIKELKSQYDVRLFFDDRIETCAAVAREDVPGCYTSVKQYWDLISGNVKDAVRSNPYRTDPTTGETVFLREHGKYFRSGVDPDAEAYAGPDAHMDPSGMGDVGINPFGPFKKKKDGAFEFGGKPYAPNPPLKPRRKKMKNGKYRKEPAKSYIRRFMSDKKMIREFPDDGQRYAVGISYVDKIYGKSGLNSLGVVLRNGEEYSEDYMVPRDVDKLHKAADNIKDTYYEGLEVPEWWKSKMSVTADQADNLSDALSYVADNPRSNPPKSKVEKGKELYKHMNGKDPDKTEMKVLDMGDVWYQVGEGGCWQIGYMSGKETGASSQKYVHHFNEETKNGDFPKLYATMPDKGKPMLIIQGGTWKIKTDDQGVAWIYD